MRAFASVGGDSRVHAPRRSTMRRLLLVGLLVFPLSALAQWATINSPVNMRAGPGREFPVVTWLRQSQRVNVVGCLPARPWCEVVWGRRRGWVHISYLGGISRGRVPTVRFGFADDWDARYRISAGSADRAD